MSTPYLGQIEIFSFGFAPKNWADCNGQLLPINQNQALFSLLGTQYGGNGTTNFALPDLRGRVPIGFGEGYTIGQAFGEERHTLLQNELPTHVHTMMADGTTAAGSNVNTPGASGTTVLGNTGGQQNPGGPFPVQLYSSAPPNGTLNPGVIGSSGNGQSHENRMPGLALRFCIALQGVFPSQN